MTTTELDQFTRAYIEAALWSSTDDSGEPLDANYGLDDLAPETLAKMAADCAKFQAENDSDFVYLGSVGKCTVDQRAGHDFWLTRCGHGAGFWDGDWSEDAGERLTEAAHKFGNVDLYVGDDGLIYC